LAQESQKVSAENNRSIKGRNNNDFVLFSLISGVISTGAIPNTTKRKIIDLRALKLIVVN
jgi:hypothetical protein